MVKSILGRHPARDGQLAERERVSRKRAETLRTQMFRQIDDGAQKYDLVMLRGRKRRRLARGSRRREADAASQARSMPWAWQVARRVARCRGQGVDDLVSYAANRTGVRWIVTAGFGFGRAANHEYHFSGAWAEMAELTDQKTSTTPHGNPPGSWWPARRLARRALAPVERFLAIEAASGILLLAAAAIALIWANSPWQASYVALWHAPLGVKLGPFYFERDLHFWINDGVMTIFFFVVGLEIRREIHRGELSELRRAALPLAAAVGGMLVPACVFLAINRGHASVSGWGIPMATDIAFAVGVLTLLGNRVSPALRILLLTVAVIDDVGAILVIAVFYSSGLAPMGFVALGAGLAGILVMQVLGVRSPWAYVLPGAVVWAGAYAAGIHPTLAGVAVGLMTPVRAWFGPKGFIERADESVAALRQHEGKDERGMLAHLDSLNEARREAVSPVERIQHVLHGWVAFGAMPLFALANAGVSLGDAAFSGEPRLVFLGVGIGLLFGKPIGIIGLSWLATRFGVAALPRGVTWPQVGLVGVVAGIGFTMSIFIAQLAFPSGVNLETAKVGILIGSGAAALFAYGLGRMILSSSLPTDPPPSLRNGKRQLHHERRE